jgi:hypothetical protein
MATTGSHDVTETSTAIPAVAHGRWRASAIASSENTADQNVIRPSSRRTDNEAVAEWMAICNNVAANASAPRTWAIARLRPCGASAASLPVRDERLEARGFSAAEPAAGEAEQPQQRHAARTPA